MNYDVMYNLKSKEGKSVMNLFYVRFNGIIGRSVSYRKVGVCGALADLRLGPCIDCTIKREIVAKSLRLASGFPRGPFKLTEKTKYTVMPFT